ncbi:MAG TPA: sugar ABC transporter permease [Spirochaetia bacterium]|nr:sugar ABC transporter permease [Spirochaetia bacterium]
MSITRRHPLRYYSFLLMLAPGLILYAALIAYPFLSSIYLSFFKWPGIGPKVFVGFANYVNILTGYMSHEFYPAFLHNLYFFALSWTLDIIPGLVMALLLSTGLRGTNVFKTIAFMPNTLSIIIVGFLWGLLLNPQWGMVNQVLKVVGLGKLAQGWLGNQNIALTVIILVTTWRGIGFYIITFFAAILGLNRSMLEAARIDGASEGQTIWRIILPQLLPIIGTVTMLKVIWSFNVFDIVYAMEGTQGGPAASTDVLGTLFYRIAFGGLGSSQVGMGLGASVVTLIFLIVFPVSIFYVLVIERRAQKG